MYAIHDIAFPFEMFTERLYNEQYMLAVYIIAGMMGDKIYFPSAYLGSCTDVLKKLDAKLRPHPDISFTEGGFFWIEKN